MLGLSLLLLLLPDPSSSMLMGWVESPGYPNGYLPHTSLNWSRCAPKGHTISIRLIHLDLEDSQGCENDAVKIFSNGILLHVLCGRMDFEQLQSSVNPLLLSYPGGCLSLSFQSDYSNTERHTGFRGFYTDQDFDECQDDPDNGCTQFCHNFVGGYYCSCRHGYHLDSDRHTCTTACSEDLSGQRRGEITSPSWPAPYSESANCDFTLSVEENLQLELLFSQDFDVEQSPDGECIDALKVETPTRTIGPFCGRTPPPSPLLTHSSHVHIRFTSDHFGSNKGFSLNFRTRGKVCPALASPHSTVSPLQEEYEPGQKVEVTCDIGHVVASLISAAVPSQYSATCQNTGVWTPNYVCEPVDCDLPTVPEGGILQLVDSDNALTKYKDEIQFHCTSVHYTLEGDATYICGDSGDWVSQSGKKELPKCIEVCGMPIRQPASAGRIMGGKDANLGEIPWHLLITGLYPGGATLISDRWAVTAAHVVENVEETSLILYGGIVGREAMTNAVRMDSEKIIIHPSYSKGFKTAVRGNYDHDIALIKFSSRVNLSPNLLPICLPDASNSLVEGEQGTVSGWGMADTEDGTFARSQTLKYAHIGVYSPTDCAATPDRRLQFTDNMFCAGAPGKDSCRQDSGGPLFFPLLAEGGEPHYLGGIVSFGLSCRAKQYKGYYTKVSNYVQWIKETIDADEAECRKTGEKTLCR